MELTRDEAHLVARIISEDDNMREAAEGLEGLGRFVGRVNGLAVALGRERHPMAQTVAGWLKEIEPIATRLVDLPPRRRSGGRGLSPNVG